MKVNQLAKVIESAERIYRENGDASVADSLASLTELCADHPSTTVAAFAKLIANAAKASHQH
jgi:hypothetical protein